MTDAIISVSELSKVYSTGFKALDSVDLSIRKGEIFALLGPNGAGKTTLINTICGIVNPTSGKITAAGYDILKDYRKTRSIIGLVPQELSFDMFEKVINTVRFSRGLFGKPQDDAHIEKILRQLTLWDKRNNKLMELSGGMKRRVMIAKALSHEPQILFLDEPTAGVDVSLRKEMWQVVRNLRQSGVTVILTTHYIEEAQEMADRVGVINKGRIILVEEKRALMQKLGKKQLVLELKSPITQIPTQLSSFDLQLRSNGSELVYEYNVENRTSEIAQLLKQISISGVDYKDLHTKQSSLEEIFVGLVGADA